VTSSAEYFQASTEYAHQLCEYGRAAEGLAMQWAAYAVAHTMHGPTSIQLEQVLLSISFCLNELGDLTGDAYLRQALEVAASRERPPSPNLMQRAIAALEWSFGSRDYEAAERYYQIAVENSLAFTDPVLRRAMMFRYDGQRACLLAWRGAADQAEATAAPVVAQLDAEFQRSGTEARGHPAWRWCLAVAQRENGRAAESARTSQVMAARCRDEYPENFYFCLGIALVTQASAELDAGQHAEALATLERRLKFEHSFDGHHNLGVAYGRALLANGRPREAIEPLRLAYGQALGSDFPRGEWAAEAEYWLGRAYIATGDVKRGRWMVAEAQRTLATSKVKSHQRLALASP
jgi:tetratricopeptide (TPR) repeat protein